MECMYNEKLTNEVLLMIRQRSISVKLDETDAAVTNFPGVVPLAGLAEQLGLFATLEDSMPTKVRKRGFSNSQAVFDLMCIALSGGSCIDDLDCLRTDKGLTRLLGRKVMASRTAHDFLRRIRYDGLDGLSKAQRVMLREVARRTNTTQVTLDVDASFFASSGKNARMSYKGERGYTPMFAFWEELGMVVHDDFRNGNASPGGQALEFLKQTLAQLPDTVEHIDVRSDSAWYQAGIMDFCEDNGHGFCIGADRDEAVKTGIMNCAEDDWHRINAPADPGDTEPFIREWATETVHTLNNSPHAYRLIIIRKERLQDDLEYGPYAYHAIITNMALPLEEQLTWYRKRGQCENQIKELKWDFETRVLPSGDYFVNATYLRIMTLAYNLFVALKRLALPESDRPLRLKTLRYRLLGVPALVLHHARRLHLKLPRGHPAFAQFQTIC